MLRLQLDACKNPLGSLICRHSTLLGPVRLSPGNQPRSSVQEIYSQWYKRFFTLISFKTSTALYKSYLPSFKRTMHSVEERSQVIWEYSKMKVTAGPILCPLDPLSYHQIHTKKYLGEEEDHGRYVISSGW